MFHVLNTYQFFVTICSLRRLETVYCGIDYLIDPKVL